MKLRELLPVIQSGITLEIAGKRKAFVSKSKIPEDYVNHIVTKITPEGNRILIALGKPKRVKTLEELGYSFEVGV